MSPYIPLLALMALAALAMAALIGLSTVIGPSRRNRAKYMSYECGIDPTPMPVDGGRFPIKYYLIAMLYIIFDIEIVFLYPWAVSFNQPGFNAIGLFTLVEMVFFMVTVFIAYVYIWRRGGLEWD